MIVVNSFRTHLISRLIFTCNVQRVAFLKGLSMVQSHGLISDQEVVCMILHGQLVHSCFPKQVMGLIYLTVTGIPSFAPLL